MTYINYTSYNEQVIILANDPSLIYQHWNTSRGIFNFMGKQCITMIRDPESKYREPYDGVKLEISLDERIKPKPKEIIRQLEPLSIDERVAVLNVYKEYRQRWEREQNGD